MKLNKEIEELNAKLRSQELTHQTLQDEFQALQTVSNSNEGKLSSLERENDQLVSAMC